MSWAAAAAAIAQGNEVRIARQYGTTFLPLMVMEHQKLVEKHARAQGAETITGLEMFIEQASRQFEIFTGETAPRSVMEKAAMEALNGNHK